MSYKRHLRVATKGGNRFRRSDFSNRLSMPVGRARARSAVSRPCALRLGAASVEELVSLHDVQAYRQTCCQKGGRVLGSPLSRIESFELRLATGGATVPAGIPTGSCVRRHRSMHSLSPERVGRTLREDSRKESLCPMLLSPAIERTSVSQFTDWPIRRNSFLRSPRQRSEPLKRPSPCRAPRGSGCDGKAVTWLILPVVICLSQRLSHACLSINCFIL